MTDESEILKDQASEDGKIFRCPTFEGPLELLLYLIQKSEVNIYDIPISSITEQFLDYIENHRDSIVLNDLSDFYRMAADLLYIKSRMLLPVEMEYDEEYEDPRKELVERLLEYQKFKKYTELLTSSSNGSEFYIARKHSDFMLPFDDQELFEDVQLNDLMKTFQKIISRVAPKKVFNVYEEVSVDEKKALLLEIFEKKNEAMLTELIVDPASPMHIICAFMAILEMCKFRLIWIEQTDDYGDIRITKRNDDDISDRNADDIDDEYESLMESGLEPDMEESSSLDEVFDEDDPEAEEEDDDLYEVEELDMEDF